MTTYAMNCRAFDDRLADYLEGDLEPGERQEMEAHLASCLRCSAIVRDIDQVRESALALPALAPSRDLWEGIAARIAAPVIPLATAAAARRTWRDRARLAAVAAALVIVTAGVTYTLTMSRVGAANRDRVVAANPADPSAARSGTRSDSVLPRGGAPSAPGRNEIAARPSEPRGAADVGDPGPGGASASRPVAWAVRNVPPSVTYSREIDRLRAIFDQNRDLLDPRTAAIIEANLRVIDDAIAQSRAALARDPASRFLDERLNSALEKKLELLRTAALLPDRAT